MMARRPERDLWRLVVLTTVFVLPLAAAQAQLSPGPLSRPHVELEGLRNCTKCHALGTREVTANCLACHREIAAMRTGKPGFHKDDACATCSDCHTEHQGLDYELIAWPQERDGFDHTTTGFALTGRHATIDCRTCHLAKHVSNAEFLQAAGKDLDRTWLGLDPACTACHDDVHQGQFTRECTQCHETGAWKPASRFDHAATTFVLDGRHRDVVCDRCHAPVTAEAGGKPYRRYAAVPAGDCIACHVDPHAGALGGPCAKCHVTIGWRQNVAGSFDHERTHYPLRGKHARVECAGCHSGERRKPAFAVCADCHHDAHGAAELQRPRLLACENCHTVDGFRPARFSLAQHDSTAFPLRGAHLAVACDACHKPLAAKAPANLAPACAGCIDCHSDPHKGQTARVQGSRSCGACHVEASWRQVTFDHAATGYPLENGHARAKCRKCHDGAVFNSGQPVRPCASCHQDIHAGQFAVDGTTACDRCHVTVDWLAETFVHDRDSRFPLRGEHEAVKCQACHLPLEGGRSLRFKPLDTACATCHRVVPKEKP
jgi:hypothetical protein